MIPDDRRGSVERASCEATNRHYDDAWISSTAQT
jgi:hypothetical protein